MAREVMSVRLSAEARDRLQREASRVGEPPASLAERLIDEMYPPVIAERPAQGRAGQGRAGQGRAGQGRDAISVIELADLIGHNYTQVCAHAISDRRAVVTENAADFLVVVKQRAAVGDAAPSLVITSNRTLPRHSRSFIGRAVRALTAFCEAPPWRRSRGRRSALAPPAHWAVMTTRCREAPST